jgi:hypothetical protein
VVWTKFVEPVLTGRGAHPAFCMARTGSFSGVMRPGRDVKYTPFSAEVEEKVEI